MEDDCPPAASSPRSAIQRWDSKGTLGRDCWPGTPETWCGGFQAWSRPFLHPPHP
uniref:Uncharacterized protein n=1 Tax=Mycoplasma suis TaxID=57372 RepID=Q8KM82_9MOLU|nr:hypothetical protein [Mycoplasma suis]